MGDGDATVETMGEEEDREEEREEEREEDRAREIVKQRRDHRSKFTKSRSSGPPLLLHRVEYTVQNVDTRLNGKQTWNATVAEIGVVYEAASSGSVEEEEEEEDEEDEEEEDDDEEESAFRGGSGSSGGSGGSGGSSSGKRRGCESVLRGATREIECTHDGVVRLTSFGVESPDVNQWEIRLSAHPQSCHVIEYGCGVCRKLFFCLFFFLLLLFFFCLCTL